MAIPLKYSIRHLVRRWRTTGLTAIAIGMVVAVFLGMMSLANGLRQAFTQSVEPLNILMLRDGATAETLSGVTRQYIPKARDLKGIEMDEDGKTPLVSAEVVAIMILAKKGGAETNVSVRGVEAVGPKLRSTFKLEEGRMFKPGLREAIVGKGLAARMNGVAVGDKIKFVNSQFTIVGHFSAEGSAFESEVWGDSEEIMTEFSREAYSSVLLRAQDEITRDAIVTQVDADPQLAALKPWLESAYYAEQTKSSRPLIVVGVILAVIMAVGAVFAAMNTMYAAISSRGYEIATLRVLGFSRTAILLSFLFESVVLCLVGGLIGCVLAFPLNGIATGTMGASFTDISFVFRITPLLMLVGIAFAAVMGVFGGFLPALQGARKPIMASLKRTE